jgi:tetratricopeptide (TPR) repeat protein
MSQTTEVMMTNINGMKLARDECNAAASAGLPEGAMMASPLKSFGESPIQPDPGDCLDDLLKAADLAKPVLDGAVREWLETKGIDPDSRAVSTNGQPISINDNDAAPFFLQYTAAPLKEKHSCERKVKNDYAPKGGDHSSLCDVVRCSVVVNDESLLAALLEALINKEVPGISVVRLKNRFANPMFTGIRDCLMNVAIEYLPGKTHYGEIQLHFAPILALKGKCHVYYEFFREFFRGTDASYQQRLQLFGFLGDLGSYDGDIEAGINAILNGKDEMKLNFLQMLTEQFILHDPDLCMRANRSLAVLQKPSEGEDTEEYLKRLNNAALALEHQGNYRESLRMHEKVLKGETIRVGPNHPDTLITVGNIANCHIKLGDNRKSLELNLFCDKSFKAWFDNYTAHVKPTEANMSEMDAMISEIRFKQYLQSWASSMNSTGIAYDNLGQYDESLDMYEKCLVVREGLLGPTHVSTNTCRMNMACVHRKKKEYQKSLEGFTKVLENQQREVGLEHPTTCNVMQNLAALHDEMGNHDEAIRIFESVVEIKQKVMGADHPSTLLSGFGLACSTANRGDLLGAIAHHERVLVARARENDPATTESLSQLLIHYDELGERDPEKTMAVLTSFVDANPQLKDLITNHIKQSYVFEGRSVDLNVS